MNIYLRELAREDLLLLNQWRNDIEISQNLGGIHRMVNLEFDQRWFDSYMSNRIYNIRSAIVDSETKVLIGVVNITEINWDLRSAEFSILIGNKAMRGKGIGTIATQSILRHAFMDRNLHRIYLYVLTENVKAIKMYKKCGFVQEGLLREAAFKSGSYRDLMIMSMLAEEYSSAELGA